jgi:rubrerythrin
MPQSSRDPWELTSLGDLLTLAAQMEQEAVDGYVALADRMREMTRPDLADLFESLVVEEKSHLSKVDEWRSTSSLPAARNLVRAPEELFDDEGAGVVAPELLSAYRAFSMAVRNEERAFVFWTYVSAHAQSDEIKKAAERMAREELGHVAKLRRERRLAFHAERDRMFDVGQQTLGSLEQRLGLHLQSMAAKAVGPRENNELRSLVDQSNHRAKSLGEAPFESAPNMSRSSQAALESALPLCELLVDSYLSIGDIAGNDQDGERARAFAAQLIHCLRALRSLPVAPVGSN